MNGYNPIHVYRGLWRFVGQRGAERWEKVTWRPGHVVSLVLPDYLQTYNARAEYPELSQHLGAPHWAGLWWWNGSAWQQHRAWSSWAGDVGAPRELQTLTRSIRAHSIVQVYHPSTGWRLQQNFIEDLSPRVLSERRGFVRSNVPPVWGGTAERRILKTWEPGRRRWIVDSDRTVRVR